MYMPKRGDICWIDYEPYVGNEEGGHNAKNVRRLMLVLSGHLYGMKTGDVIGMPITSTVNAKFRSCLIPVQTIHHKIHGYIICCKLNSFDFHTRRGERAIDHLADFVWPDVNYYFGSMFRNN